MNDTIKKLVKVKAEMVNEFEFENDSHGITLSNFDAKVSVKLINVVKELGIRKADDWDKRHGKPDIIVEASEGTVKQLADFGMRADYSEIIEKYATAVEKMKVLRVKAVADSRGAMYDNSDVFLFIDEAEKTIKDMKVEPSHTREEFISNSHIFCLHVQLTYKGFDVLVDIKEERYGKRVKYYFKDNSLTGDWRMVWSFSPIKLVKKFKALVDIKIEAKKYKEEAKVKENKHFNTLAKLIADKLNVKIELEDEYSRYTQRSYKVTKLVIGKKTYKLETDAEMKKFAFAGIGSLTIDQVSKIINIIK